MPKTVLFFLLNQYSDWEAAYVMSLIAGLGKDQYAIKTLALTKDPVRSFGGLTILPDYDLASVPDNFDALILIGGMLWRTEEAKKITPLVCAAIAQNKVLGGICDASAFLGTIGVLNTVQHTSNDINDLKQWAGDAYSGEHLYLTQPAARDQNIVTANGTAGLEFAKEVLMALEIAPEEKICEWYDFLKLGCYEAPVPTP